jgi:opacity protein-like surface antigen
MVRLAAATVIVTMVLASCAFAQDSSPKLQVFGGYSYMHEPTGGLTDLKVDLALHDPTSEFNVTKNFNGWSTEAQYNANHWFGVAADFGGHTGSPFAAFSSSVGGLPDESRYALLVGPVLTFHTKTKLTPYVHALFGVERVHLAASTLTGYANPASSVSTTYNDFTVALGGGIDYRINRRFSIRGGQVEWYRTALDLSSFYNSAFNTFEFDGLSIKQRNIRFSSGVVVKF